MPSSEPNPSVKRPVRILGEFIKRQNWGVILLMIGCTIALSTPIYYRRIIIPVDTDYGSHIRFVEQWLRGEGFEPLTASHPLLQYILIAMRLASRGRLNLYHALIMIQVGVQVITVVILYVWFGHAKRRGWDLLRAFAALSLTFIAPIMLLAPLDKMFYFGYIGMANYHNPTIHLLKPVALLSFLHAVRALSGQPSRWGQILLAAFWITISTWIKPNYALIILPGLALAAGIRWLRKEVVDIKMLMCGFALPAVIMLALQWLIAYHFGDPGESIIFAPLSVERGFSGYLLLKFLLSCAFPLSILVIARRYLLKDDHLLAGWTAFAAGIAQLYLLAEGGDRLLHGNFRWSAQIALFLLFAVSLRWLLREKILTGGLGIWQKFIAYNTYLAHLAGGIAYYIYCMVSVRYG